MSMRIGIRELREKLAPSIESTVPIGGIRVRELIESYSEAVAFYVAESNLEEAIQYLAELAPRRGIPDQPSHAALTSILTAVQSFRR